ncbi:MAG TPA: CPBP family intramembrane glutamic endopeptidase [Steroidobacteraceae bacterium]|nr:CPBP family intramembrane glutamic endopeptidase [Steroidobacteraceae bacterium]
MRDPRGERATRVTPEAVGIRSTAVVLDIAAFAALVAADAKGLLPISQTLFLVPLVWLALRLRRERWRSIGFSLPDRRGRAVAIGVAAGLLMEGFAVTVTTPMISGWFGTEPDYSQFAAIKGNPRLLLTFLALSWTLAAVGEELCFRGFLMNRVARVFGCGRLAWGASLLATSVLFGWGHTEQGIAGWVQEGLSGLLLGLLFLATGRNLLAPIVAHGVSNTVAFVLIYLGRYPGLGA